MEETGGEEVVAGHAIPFVDLSRLLDPRSSEEELANLGAACHHWGFFQDVKRDNTEFYKLPLETKKVHAQVPGGLEGYGQVFVVSETQKLDWADMIYLTIRPKESRDLRFWLTQPPSFRDTMDSFANLVCAMSGCCLQILSNGRYRSIEHRAIVHPDKDRISAAVFHQPCPDATVGPLPELVKKDSRGARFKSMGYMDFMKSFFKAKLDGRRSNMDALRICYLKCLSISGS
ncbi:S-norcoclaurine synthase 1 [Dichanthelium oligosanthes]|uniref:S-norcoclaurine synthase 1 n=1 Tax=Dichanthelium oligosanthes TaxID=888268 RepID=A0A1E5UQ11_9POAL|nr:S-norcoclaurine synthase 1 [Dichanthelium oligosanthes]